MGNDKGFTFMELVITVVLASIIGAGAFQVLSKGAESFHTIDTLQELNQTGRIVLERIHAELTRAGNVVITNERDITIQIDNDPNDNGNDRVIQYQVDTDTHQLTRNMDGVPLVILEDVDTLGAVEVANNPAVHIPGSRWIGLELVIANDMDLPAGQRSEIRLRDGCLIRSTLP